MNPCRVTARLVAWRKPPDAARPDPAAWNPGDISTYSKVVLPYVRAGVVDPSSVIHVKRVRTEDDHQTVAGSDRRTTATRLGHHSRRSPDAPSEWLAILYCSTAAPSFHALPKTPRPPQLYRPPPWLQWVLRFLRFPQLPREPVLPALPSADYLALVRSGGLAAAPNIDAAGKWSNLSAIVVRPHPGERVLYKGPFKRDGVRRSVFSNLHAMEGIANVSFITNLAKWHQLCTVQLRLAGLRGQRSGACLRPLCKDTPPLFLAERRRSPSQRVLRLPRNRGTSHYLSRHRSRYPPRMSMFAPGSTLLGNMRLVGCSKVGRSLPSPHIYFVQSIN